MQFINIDTEILSLFVQANDIYKLDLQKTAGKINEGILTLYSKLYPTGYAFPLLGDNELLKIYTATLEQLKKQDSDFTELITMQRRLCVRRPDIKGAVYDWYVDNEQCRIYEVKLLLEGNGNSDMVFASIKGGDYNVIQDAYNSLRLQIELVCSNKIAKKHCGSAFWEQEKTHDKDDSINNDWVMTDFNVNI